ncbi:MAG: uncharacterized protein A8A55_2592, partial [Amphiamblys sp. WSBS2006]
METQRLVARILERPDLAEDSLHEYLCSVDESESCLVSLLKVIAQIETHAGDEKQKEELLGCVWGYMGLVLEVPELFRDRNTGFEVQEVYRAMLGEADGKGRIFQSGTLFGKVS